MEIHLNTILLSVTNILLFVLYAYILYKIVGYVSKKGKKK